jgi:excisionase family DNA binding protein
MNKERTKENDGLLSTRLYTLTEVEKILGVSHRTLLRWVTEGKIEAVKVGSRWKVSEDTLRTILEATNVSN